MEKERGVILLTLAAGAIGMPLEITTEHKLAKLLIPRLHKRTGVDFYCHLF